MVFLTSLTAVETAARAVKGSIICIYVVSLLPIPRSAVRGNIGAFRLR